MKPIDKPKTLNLDGESWVVDEDNLDPMIGKIGVLYPRGILSPYEAEQLRDWLNDFLDWYYERQ